MAVLVRLYDFTPMTLIQSQQVDDELNQLVNLVSGVSTNKEAVFTLSHATIPPVATNQTGAGPLAIWKKSGTNTAAISNAGDMVLDDSAVFGWTASDPATTFPSAFLSFVTPNEINMGGVVTHSATARSSGAPTFYSRVITPADTGLTASTESVGIQFGGNASAATVTRQHATGALTTQRECLFVNPTYAFVGASTLTNAATVAIAGAPVAGANATITNSYALWVQAGRSQFDGTINGMTLTNTTGTFTLAAGKTLTVSNSLTLAGTDGTTLTFQGTDTYVGRATTDTLTNKTLAASSDVLGRVTLTLGSDATGDVYYRDSGGLLTRLEIGSDGQVLTVAAGLPSWAASGGGSGTVNTGVQYNLAFYPANGTTVDDLANLVTNADGILSHACSVRTSGSPAYYFQIRTPADTGLDASLEHVGIQFGGNNSAATVTRQHAAGALTTQREYLFVHPTYSFVGASTLTTAATVAITGAPVAGTNATITNPLALWVQAGNVCIGSLPSGTQYNLTVNSTGVNSVVRVKGTSADFLFYAGANTTGFGVFDVSAGLDRIHIDSNGLFGVGIFSGLGAQLHTVVGSASRVGAIVTSAANSSVDLVQWNLTADDTSTVANLASFTANSNGTAAAGFGTGFTWLLESSTTNGQTAALMNVFWTTATHASRTSAIAFQTVVSGSAAERFRIHNNGVAINFSATTAYPLDIRSADTSAAMLRMQHTSTSGFNAFDFFDAAGTAVMGVGFGNSALSDPFTSRGYISVTNGTNFVFMTAAVATNTARWAVMNSGDFVGNSAVVLGWTSSATDPAGTRDTGFRRGAAGRVETLSTTTAFGTLLRGRYVLATAGATTLALGTTDSTDGIYTNEGSTGLLTINLPTAAAGLAMEFYCQDADGIRVVAATGDTIRLAGSVSASAGRIDSTTVGSYVALVAINATEWVARMIVGTWAVT